MLRGRRSRRARNRLPRTRGRGVEPPETNHRRTTPGVPGRGDGSRRCTGSSPSRGGTRSRKDATHRLRSHRCGSPAPPDPVMRRSLEVTSESNGRGCDPASAGRSRDDDFNLCRAPHVVLGLAVDQVRSGRQRPSPQLGVTGPRVEAKHQVAIGHRIKVGCLHVTTHR